MSDSENILPSCVVVDADYVNGHYIVDIVNNCDYVIYVKEIKDIIPYNFNSSRINQGIEVNNVLILNRYVNARSRLRIDIEGTLIDNKPIDHSIIVVIKINQKEYAYPHTFSFPREEIREIGIEDVKKEIKAHVLISNRTACVGEPVTITFKISLGPLGTSVRLVHIKDAIPPFATNVEVAGPFERDADVIKINRELDDNESLKITLSFQMEKPLEWPYEPILVFNLDEEQGRVTLTSTQLSFRLCKD